MASNFFDQFDPSTAKPEGGGNFFDQFDPASAKPAPPGGTMSDLGKSVKAGVQKLPGMVAGLADLPFALAGARPFTNAANALGEATGFTPGKWADETKFSKGYEDGRAAVDAAWKDGSAADIAGAYLTNPGYTLNQVAESLPSMVAGGVASKALLGVGRVAGMAADAVAGTAARAATPGLLARTVGEKWAVPVAAGVGEGAVTAGQQMAEYQGDDQQKNALASLGAGVGTGLIGGVSGRVANKFGLETAETAMARMGSRAGGAGADVPPSLKRRVLGGMVSEAVLQELPQSAQEQMWNNFANGKPVMEGVARAGVEGALAGGVMGAGANLRGPGAQPANNAQPAADPAADAPPSPAPQLGYSPLAGTPTVFPDGSVALGSEAELAHRYAPQPVKPSEEMGIDPATGPLSAAAASAVDSGTYMPPADQAAPAAPEPDPVVLQNRDRTSAASIAQMQDIAANPDYLRVGPSRDMTSGAPVVFGELPPTALLGRPETVVDGKGERMGTQYAVVDAGDLIASNNADGTAVAEYATGAPGKLRAVADNGRAAGLQAAYGMGTAGNYRQELANDAAALGLDPQAIATMQRPVLVRVMQSADVTNDMGDRTNITATQKLSPLEQARIADENTRQGSMFGAEPTLSRQAIFARLGDGANPIGQGIAPATAQGALNTGPLDKAAGKSQSLSNGLSQTDAAKTAQIIAAQTPTAIDSIAEKNQFIQTNPNGEPNVTQADQAQQATPQQPAQVAQVPVERHPNWRKNAIQAGRVARSLGIDPTGKRLAQMVADIDAHDSGQNQAEAAVNTAPTAINQVAVIPKENGAKNEGTVRNKPRADNRQAERGGEAGGDARSMGSRSGQQASGRVATRNDGGSQELFTNADARLTGGNGRSTRPSAGDSTTAYSDTVAPKAAATAFDKQIMGMANAGRSVRDILRTIQAQSSSKLNRQVAALLLKMQAIPKVEAVGRIYNRDGGLVGGVYQGKTDTVQLSLLGEAGAERTFMHEMAHAATIQSLRRGGMAAQRMKALFARVQKDSALAGEYGVTDVYEFAAEVFSNPRFREALNSINEGTLWQNFVNIVRSILGLSTDQRTALSNALIAGQQVMAEDKATRASTAERAGGQFNAAPMNAQPQDFVPNADGGLDYGEITPEMGKVMRRQAAPIRLRQGSGDGGLRHIQRSDRLQQIKSAGYDSAADFVRDVAQNFDAVHKGRGSSLFLVKKTNRPNSTLVVQLEAGEDGDFYDVKTALVSRTDFMNGKELLWERAQSNRSEIGIPSAISGQSSASVAPKDATANYARADEGMSPDLARAILALGQPAQSATKESVRAAVRELVNGGGLLPNRLGRVVVATAAEIKKHWEPLIGPVAMESEGAGRAQGFYDPKTKTVFLIADHIQAGDELGVVAHELMHKHGPAVLGEQGWSQLHGAIEGWATAAEDSMERKVYDEAARRVQASGPELSSQELFPYAVQVALEMGVRPNAIAPKGSIERWLGQVRAALRQVWSKIATHKSDFKSLDLVNLAFAIAQRENPATGTSLDAQGATMQDTEAASFSHSAMKSVEANVARGRQALAKALTERASVNRAMFRNGLGWVDFVWGDGGVVKADGRTKGGMGIAHILEARQRKDGLSEQETVRFLDDVVRTIAEGRELSRQEVGLSTRVGLEHNSAIVWMTKKQGGNAWVVTGYEKSPGGAAAGRATSAPTHNAASLTRGEVGAGDGKSVADSGRNGKSSDQPDILFSRNAPAAAIRTSMGELTPEQASAYQRVAGTKKVPTLKERFAVLKANFGLKARQALVDQFAAIKQLDQHAYMQARMSKASDGTLEAALLYGKPFMNGGVPDVNMADGGFAKVLASLDGEHDRLLMWMAALRADRLKAEGKENLMTDDDISSLKTLNAGKMKDGRSRPQVYAKALGEINAFNEAMLKIGMESGLIDQAAYDIMKDQPYVPFYRLMEDDGVQGPRFSSGLTGQQAFKKLKGGSQQLNADLLENMLLSWSSMLQASAKNRAALATMDAAEKMAVAYKVPATTHGKATKGAVKVMRDGITEHWMVEDPYLLEAIGALHYTVSPLMKPLTKMKQILTMAVTVNPTFKIRNLIRDSISAIAQSELGYNPAANVKNAWKLTAKDSQIYASMLAGGGIIKFGTQENTDRLRAQVAKLGGTMLDKTGTQKLMGQVGELWEVYSEFGDRTENVNRAALYDQLIKKGKSHAEASFMARDLMDFSMGGGMPLVRFLTQTVPFLNARLVGLDKLGRAAMDDPRKFATMAGAVAMASVALMMMYGDDDDWKKREDWHRDAYWWFKIGDKAFSIPKPFELGAIGTMAERTAELMFSKEMTNKRFTERMAHMLAQTFAFDPIPQAIKPLLDVYSNKDSFTKRAIETPAEQRMKPADRYNERTSEVAKLLGKMGLPEPSQLIKGDYVGMSPKQIDHLIRGYFSWVGVTATTAADMLVRPALDRGERPALRLKDAFVIGNFVESLPTGSSRYVSQMYEQSHQVQQAYASYREAVKLGDMDKARSIQAEDGDKLRSRIGYDHATQQMSKLGQQAKKVEADRSLSAADKRERLDALEQRRGAIAKRAVERAGV